MSFTYSQDLYNTAMLGLMAGMLHRTTRISGVVYAVLAVGGGCASTLPQEPDRSARIEHGYVYYLDGAGGGGRVNFAGGVRQGLLDAGYPGAGELFTWNTGLGIVADQEAKVDYKRSKATELANRIVQYLKEHPKAPVTLMGLSAGAAVAVFTLEALPETCLVENCVLLSGSISEDYDLTVALRRIRNRMYVFTSEHDAVLAFAVPLVGTADRRRESRAAGLRGFRLPVGASEETRILYAKIAHIDWNPTYATAGHAGGHIGTVQPRFVQQYVAPLIMSDGARSVAASGEELVPSPDYARWAGFEPGASVVFEGYQVVAEQKQEIRLTARLVSKHDDRLLVERAYLPIGTGQQPSPQVQNFIYESKIPRSQHPITHPDARVRALPEEMFKLGRDPLRCHVRTVEVNGEFRDYGQHVWAELYEHTSIPGGLVKVWLKASRDGLPYEFQGQVVEYRVR